MAKITGIYGSDFLRSWKTCPCLKLKIKFLNFGIRLADLGSITVALIPAGGRLNTGLLFLFCLSYTPRLVTWFKIPYPSLLVASLAEADLQHSAHVSRARPAPLRPVDYPSQPLRDY